MFSWIKLDKRTNQILVVKEAEDVDHQLNISEEQLKILKNQIRQEFEADLDKKLKEMIF